MLNGRGGACSSRLFYFANCNFCRVKNQKRKINVQKCAKIFRNLAKILDNTCKIWYTTRVDLSFVESLKESRSLGLKAPIKRVVGRATLRFRSGKVNS